MKNISQFFIITIFALIPNSNPSVNLVEAFTYTAVASLFREYFLFSDDFKGTISSIILIILTEIMLQGYLIFQCFSISKYYFSIKIIITTSLKQNEPTNLSEIHFHFNLC